MWVETLPPRERRYGYSVQFLLLYLLHLLTLLKFSFLLTSLLSRYPIIFVLSQGHTRFKLAQSPVNVP
jgi:hypothetical protein